MHDRRQRGQEPAVVDDLTEARLPIEDLADTITLDGITADDPDAVVGGKECESPADEPESPLARRAKLIALLVVAVLLVASVIIASAITGGSDLGTGRETREITGAAALGGFALPATRRSGHSGDTGHLQSSAGEPDDVELAVRPPVSPPVEDVTDVAGPVQAVAEPEEAPSTTGDTGQKGPAGDRVRAESGTTGPGPSGADLVRDFYALVNTAPESALALVTPDVIGDAHEGLLSAWRSMATIVVDRVDEHPDGTVTVVVIMTPDYGDAVEVTQRLGFGDGPQPVINHAALLAIKTL